MIFDRRFLHGNGGNPAGRVLACHAELSVSFKNRCGGVLCSLAALRSGVLRRPLDVTGGSGSAFGCDWRTGASGISRNHPPDLPSQAAVLPWIDHLREPSAVAADRSGP